MLSPAWSICLPLTVCKNYKNDCAIKFQIKFREMGKKVVCAFVMLILQQLSPPPPHRPLLTTHTLTMPRSHSLSLSLANVMAFEWNQNCSPASAAHRLPPPSHFPHPTANPASTWRYCGLVFCYFYENLVAPAFVSNDFLC